MKNFKRVLSLALAALMVIGGLVIAPVDAKAEGTYTKVTSVDEIKAGGNFVVIAKSGEKYYAMATSGTDFRESVEVNVSATGELTKSEQDIPVWTIGKITGTESITFSSGDKYAYWKDGDKNKLKMTSDETESGIAFSVEKNAEDGTFTFKNVGDSTRIISYNASSPRFACYTGSQIGNLLVYKYSGAVDVPQDISLDPNATPAEIVDAAYRAKEEGVNLLGTWTLQGVIVSVDTAYSEQYQNITVSMVVGDKTDKPIQCYRLAGTGIENLEVGDKITVEGTLSYHGSKVQYSAGSTLKAYEKGQIQNTLPDTATPAEIVNAAYDAMNNGTTMIGTYTLEGVIISVDTAYSAQYENITVTMVVGDMTDKPIQCYRLAGTGIENLTVGDKIKVEGTLSYYNGKVQFAQGCTLKAYEAGEIPNSLPDNATQEEIVNAAYALEGGTSLIGTYTLTGVITSVDEAYSSTYSNITVTMVVNGMTAKPIMCYRLKGTGADLIGVGDTITVTGELTNYVKDEVSTIEFKSGCTLASYTLADGGSGSGDGGSGSGDGGSGSGEEMTQKEIVDAAYALGAGEYLGGSRDKTYKLTGKIVSLEEVQEYQGAWEIKLTINVEGKDFFCYWLKGTEANLRSLKLGDVITVEGPIKNYVNSENVSTIEFEIPQLVSIGAKGDNATPVVAVLFVGLALVGVAFVSKRKMA